MSISQENDIDAIIHQLGPCARPYLEFDKCMEVQSRNYSKCVQETKALKRCWDDLNDKGLRDLQKEREMMMKVKEMNRKRMENSHNNELSNENR